MFITKMLKERILSVITEEAFNRLWDASIDEMVRGWISSHFNMAVLPIKLGGKRIYIRRLKKLRRGSYRAQYNMF